MKGTSTRLAVALAVATFGFGMATVVLDVASWRAEDLPASAFWDGTVLFLVQLLALPVVGWLLASKRSANPIGWLLLAAGLATSYAAFADAWGYHGLVARPGSLPIAEWVLWSGWVGLAGLVLPAVFVILLFPDGKLPSPRWRPVGWAGAAGGVLALGAGALRPGPLPEFQPAAVPNPAAIDGADAVLAAVQGIAGVMIGAAVIAATVSLVVRFRHADRRQRGQLSFLALAAAALVVTLAAGNLLTGGQIKDHFVLDVIGGLLLLAGVPAAIAAAILWQGLYDLDRLVRRSVVYGLLWSTIVAVYISVAWSVGVTAGGRMPVGLAVLVTVVVTVVFEPSRHWLNVLAERWVFGPRPDTYELTAALGEVVDDTDDLGQLARRLAELAGRSLGAAWVDVTVLDVDGDEATARYLAADAAPPTDPPLPVRLSVPLIHREVHLGVIECGPRHDGGYGNDHRRLVELLAREAALAVHGLRLAASLAGQVDTVRRQAAELAASRARIVAAQDAERRRIERNIHDGVQQELVALIAKVRLARDRIDRDPAAVAAGLAAVQDDAGRVLRDLRDLAQGIHPTVLTDQGLVWATEDRASRLPLDVQVHADPVVRTSRYDDAVEGAAYFVVSEALANVLKHADAERAHVRLAQANGHLRVEIADDGRGLPAHAAPAGSALQALADRVHTLGGDLQIETAPGQGTTVVANLPAHPHLDPVDLPDQSVTIHG